MQLLTRARVSAGAPPLTGKELDFAVAEWAEVVCVIPRDELASVYRYAKANRERKSTGFPITPDEVLLAYKEMCAPKFLSTADAWRLATSLIKPANEKMKQQLIAQQEVWFHERRQEWNKAVAKYKAGETEEIEGCWWGYDPEKEFNMDECTIVLSAHLNEYGEPEILSAHPLLQKVLRMYGWGHFCYTPQEHQQRFVFDYKAEVEHALKEWSDSFSRNL